MAGFFSESELPEHREFGELPDDLRAAGPLSIPGIPDLIEGDGYTLNGGADRSTMDPVPPPLSPSFTAISVLPRQNFESFRSQRFVLFGNAVVAPSSGTTFTSLTTRVIPQGFAGVVTGFSQWIGDAAAYLKADGTADDITWRISLSGTPVFDYGNLNCILSSPFEEAKMFIVLTENTLIDVSVTNNIVSSSFGARSIPVSVKLTGHIFPMDEIDDMFRNR